MNCCNLEIVYLVAYFKHFEVFGWERTQGNHSIIQLNFRLQNVAGFAIAGEIQYAPWQLVPKRQ